MEPNEHNQFLILTSSWFVHSVQHILLNLLNYVLYMFQSGSVWKARNDVDEAYPRLRVSGCNSPTGRPSAVKCFKNSLASSKAGEPFGPSLGPSKLSLDPGPNRPNL